MPPADSRTWLWMVLTLALVLRVGAAVGLQVLLDRRPGQTFLIEGDANGYWGLAEKMAAGEDFALYSPPRRVLRMPGFPLLLSLPIKLFANPLLPARLMLAGVGTLACGLVWLLGDVLFAKRVANMAAGLAAVSPVMVGFSPVVLSETTFAAALLASLIGMGWWARHDASVGRTSKSVVHRVINIEADVKDQDGLGSPSYIRSAIIGLVIGALIAVACYVRPSGLLAGPLFGLGAIILSVHKSRAVVMAVCVMIGLIGLLLPWGLRNQRVTGHFTLTTFWVGPSLYDGLNPHASGDSDMEFFDRDNLMAQGMTEYDVDRHYRREAWAFVKDQPGRTIELAFIKLWRYFKPWPNAEQFGGWWPALAIGPLYVITLGLALRGWWVIRQDVWAWGLTIGPLFYFAALHTVFVSSLRYRLPAEYPLMVLAAVGWCSWGDRGSRAGVTGG